MRWAFIVQLAALIALSLAFKLPCGVPLPFNNKTLQAIEAIRNKTLDPGSLGSATTFGGNTKATEWPRNAQNEAVIFYCFYTEFDRNQLRTNVENAMEHWIRALGGPASSQTNHGIAWKERQHGGTYALCNPSRNPMIPDYWNPNVPYETLMIQGSFVEDSSNAGFYAPSQPGEMRWVLRPTSPEASNIHELGHVMGMAHEHQRTDRDMFVRYRCDKIVNFAEAYSKVIMIPFMTVQQLCEDFGTASMANFLGRDYIAGHFAGDTIRTDGTPYDVNSIMHYPSKDSGNAECRAGKWEECPLVKYKNPSNHGQGIEEILEWTTPSQADIRWVKSHYPWRAPPNAVQHQPQPIP